MRVFRRRQQKESSEVQTVHASIEQIKSHPLEVDSDSEASFTSALDNQGDLQLSPGVIKLQERPHSPFDTAAAEHRVKQQASSQTADCIASHTPTRLSNAKGIGDSVQSLAHEIASAAASRASNLTKEAEAAKDAHVQQTPKAPMQVMPQNARASLPAASPLPELPKRAAVHRGVLAQSYLTALVDWAVSTLYYSTGVVAAVTEGIAKALTARR